MVIAGFIANGTALNHFTPSGHACFKALGRHALGRPDRVRCFHREWDIKGAIFTTQKARSRERFQLFGFAMPFEFLTDVDKSRNGRVSLAKHLCHPRTDMWCSNGLRWHIPCMPMILVPRMQDSTKVGHAMRTNNGSPIHHLCDIFQSLRNANTIHHGWNRRKGGKNGFRPNAHFIGRIAFRVKSFGPRHAPAHPQKNAAISGGFRLLNFFSRKSPGFVHAQGCNTCPR